MSSCQAAATACWLGETWGFWIQTGALFLSVLAAVAVIYYNGKQGRTKALIDLLIHQRSDQTLVAAEKAVFAMQRSAGHLSAHLANRDGPEFKHILDVLNSYEFLAVGIRLGAFNENVYKELQCSNVLKLWDAVNGFVAELRRQEGKDTLFQDLERLARRWKAKPIKKVH